MLISNSVITTAIIVAIGIPIAAVVARIRFNRKMDKLDSLRREKLDLQKRFEE